MSFNQDKYQEATFEFREREVPVPELKDFFPEGDRLVWRVRNLTGLELFSVHEAVERNNRKVEAVEALFGGDRKERIEALQMLACVHPDLTPTEYVRRLETFKCGSVDPKVNHDFAVKFAHNHGHLFSRISGEILLLTVQGAEPGK